MMLSGDRAEELMPREVDGREVAPTVDTNGYFRRLPLLLQREDKLRREDT